MPLKPRHRGPARRLCPNGGCWACLGACRGTAQRTEVVTLGKAAPPATALDEGQVAA
ncbi:MAG: hypothetical protein QOJ26_1533 [Thermoplasmata archaeon]|nr:hypothetical protein [Thermoplasmata archaeon]